ncbi:hypothetical protein GCM10011608_04690 [Micromonospora sonchi]|uniref:Uncharacterized protein n=1 Tax=Micromonospora sonchi TaxID=1763543 RepID=A0A917THZ2_9ACTN|nr:hypothetical protein GCM10011608_04690 [Micromonospora sonchi]
MRAGKQTARRPSLHPLYLRPARRGTPRQLAPLAELLTSMDNPLSGLAWVSSRHGHPTRRPAAPRRPTEPVPEPVAELTITPLMEAPTQPANRHPGVTQSQLR